MSYSPRCDSGVSSTLMESDGGLSVHVDAGSVVLPDHLGSDADVAPTDTMPQAQIYRGYQFGRVVYTHGPGIDAPLSLIRMDYSDSIRTPQRVVLHNDWRGEYDIGSYAGGTLTKPCMRITRSSNFKTVTSDGTISDYPKAPGPINTSWYYCVEVEWPAPHVWVTRDTRNRSLNGPLAWMGTLIDGMRDNSGQMYMRNRYYDPASGRFTRVWYSSQRRHSSKALEPMRPDVAEPDGLTGTRSARMSQMDCPTKLAAEFRRELAEDFVGLWEISGALGAGDTCAEHADEIIAVVEAMLDDDTVTIGQFSDGEFVAWKAPRSEILERLRHELAALGREPTIGEVAWLAQRPGPEDR